MINSEELNICATIAGSGLFDTDYYLKNNPDVAQSGMDPIIHYVRYGEAEGRSPSPTFKLYLYKYYFSHYENILYEYIKSGGAAIPELPEIPVIFSVNEDYIPYLAVAIASIRANASPNYKYRLYILHNSVEANKFYPMLKLQKENIIIQPLDIGERVADLVEKAFVSKHIAVETYFRILIPKLFENYQKVIYLDSDLIIKEDIRWLYMENIVGFALGAVPEFRLKNDFFQSLSDSLPSGIMDNYFNAGVLLINVDYFNKHNLAQRCLELVSGGKKYICWDQDILNIVTQGKVKSLDLKWNYPWAHLAAGYFKHMERDDFAKWALYFNNPSIVHFASNHKPWLEDDGHFAAMFWEYAKQTPYFSKIAEKCPYRERLYNLGRA